MAKERLRSPRARLFVALDLPEAVLSGIEAWGRNALRDPGLRPVRRESLHVTLAFLGYLPEREIGRLAEILAATPSSATRFELQDPIAKPSPGRARLFALPAASAGAVEIQAGLQERLVAARLYEPEKRPFWPHVTVARVRPEARGSKRPARVSDPPGGLPRTLRQPANFRRLTLYRSQLQPEGAHYVPLAQIELSGDGQR